MEEDARNPARDTYDAVVDIATNARWGAYAFALVKRTYRITARGECERIVPEPLEHDMRDEDLEPRLKAGSDFWPVKLATDVVVQGAAFPPAGKTSTPETTVSLSVGAATKRVKVFGRRALHWNKHGNPHFTRPEPFEEVPLTWENAYGGIDFRASDPGLEGLPSEAYLDVDHDHPGLYPRNPFGKGYLVESDPVDDLELPRLEDPSDLLTPERIITGDPRAWYEQPLPWTFEWVHPMMFPRFAHFINAPEAWFPAPEDRRLPEIERGYLAENFREEVEERPIERGPAPRFKQGASHGLILHDVPEQAPVRIEGMHPEKPTLRFRLPAAPSLEMQVENERRAVQPRLHSIVLRPGEETFYLLHGAAMEIERPLIPGIHKHIPLAVYVDGDRPVAYEAPVPTREQLEQAMAQDEDEREDD